MAAWQTGLLRAPGVLAALGLVLALGACGGGGSSSSVATRVSLPASPASISDPNVALVEVRQGVRSNVNIPYVSVTVCQPGAVPSSSTCRTINDVLLDTGSTGLRLFSSAANQLAGLVLPAQTLTGVPTLYECAQFLNTVALGTVNLADVSIGAEKAASLPIQLMNASPALLGATSPCGQAPMLATTTDAARNLQSLSANGILGVSMFTHDGQGYFSCATYASGCMLANVGTSKQVQNPVSSFGLDNNGVVVQLPALPATGALSVQGFLIFGVGTRANNQLGSANVVSMNSSGINFTTGYKGRNYTMGFFDSGSNGVYFDDPTIPVCSGSYADFYCPSSTLTLSASIPVLGAAPVNVSYSVANANTLFTSPASSGNFAFANLSAPMDSPVPAIDPLHPDNFNPNFDWGLPFFFGRSVYTVTEGPSPNAATGALSRPFNAFSN